MDTKQSLLSMLLVSASCVGNDSRVAVEPNELGVATIETDRYVDHGDSVFALRANDASDDQVASVRVRIGAIADLPELEGTEIVTVVGANETRSITSEMTLVQLSPLDAETAEFFAIPTVAHVLASEANVVTTPTPNVADTETPLSSAGCPSNLILSSPTAFQCCYDGSKTLFGDATWNSVAPQQQTVTRTKNPYGTACKAADGQSACGGTGCYYGPLGFSRPVMSHPNNNYYLMTVKSGSCSANWMGTTPGPGGLPFSDMTGTAARGQGCPGGAPGAAWDYSY